MPPHKQFAGNYGAACCPFCHSFNIPTTAFTEACCAGTDPPLVPDELLNVVVIGAMLVVEPLIAILDSACFEKTSPAPYFVSSLYKTACGTFAPSQRRS